MRELPLLWDKVSAAQAGLKLIAIPLPQLPECRDDWPVSPCLAQEGTFVFVRHPHQDQASMLPLTPEVLTAVLSFQVACEFGVLRVVSQTSRTRSRDYCILYNPQWAHLPHDLSKVVSVTLGHTATHLGVLGWALCPSGPEFSCAGGIAS